MFLYSCFIRKNTPELRKKLEELGYEKYLPLRDDDNYEGYCIATLNGAYHLITIDLSKGNHIDCGTNEELLLAIAALRDDSDYMQVFKMNNENDWYRHIPAHRDSKDESAYKVLREDKWHKATVEELIEYFK
jgi:hypothetical protein